MVIYVLYVKADLEGVDTLSYVLGSNLCISVRNPSTQTAEIREKIVCDASELQEAEVGAHDKHCDTAAHFHFSMKWDKIEQHRSTVRILGDEYNGDATADEPKKKGSKKKRRNNDNTGVTLKEAIRSEDSGKFVPILKLECDGLEPYAFHPLGEDFSVTNKAGDKIDKVDLSSGDWSTYELSSGSTSVTNFEAKFE